MKTPTTMTTTASNGSEFPQLTEHEQAQYYILKALNLAADIFAASPCKTFTREDVVKILRGVGEEVCSDEMLFAYKVATTMGAPEALQAFRSQPTGRPQ